MRWSSSSPRGWWWRGYGVGSTRGGVPSGASPLFCFWRGYELWVMCYVLCLTHNLYPLSRFPFPILHPSGRPSACASPSSWSVDSGRRRGIVKQSGKQSVPQSVPQSVAVLLRQKGAVSRAVSRAVSLPMAGIGEPVVDPIPRKSTGRGEACRSAPPPSIHYGTPRRHYGSNNHTARVGFSPSVRRNGVRRGSRRPRISQRCGAIPADIRALRRTAHGSPRSTSVRGSYGSRTRST